MIDSSATIALRDAIAKHFWWHSIDLGNGVVTPGQKTPEAMAIESALFFDPVDLTGRSVLDVGTWNGDSRSRPSGVAQDGFWRPIATAGGTPSTKAVRHSSSPSQQPDWISPERSACRGSSAPSR